MIIRWSRGLCTDSLAFVLQLRKTSARRPSDEGCVTSLHLKCGPLPPNEVGRIAQHVKQREGRSIHINYICYRKIVKRKLVPFTEHSVFPFLIYYFCFFLPCYKFSFLHLFMNYLYSEYKTNLLVCKLTFIVYI